jgi:hypothetical protein
MGSTSGFTARPRITVERDAEEATAGERRPANGAGERKVDAAAGAALGAAGATGMAAFIESLVKKSASGSSGDSARTRVVVDVRALGVGVLRES